MDKYIVIRSTDNKDTYPHNEHYNFRVNLGEELHVDHKWMIGLCDITVSDWDVENKEDRDIYVCSSVCNTSYVGGGYETFLRYVFLNNEKKQRQFMFPSLYYVPVKVHDLRTIDLYIKDSQGALASFVTGTVTATLHLKPLPFWF